MIKAEFTTLDPIKSVHFFGTSDRQKIYETCTAHCSALESDESKKVYMRLAGYRMKKDVAVIQN